MSTGNVATFGGRRRSEKKVPHPYDGMTQEQIRDKNEENHPMFPGYHTVVVPQMNAMGPGYPSNSTEYEGMGYQILSKDPKVTGHGDNVLMGIPLEEHYRRQDELEAQSTGRFTELIDLIQDDIEESVNQRPMFKNAKARLNREASGMELGEAIQVGVRPDEEEAPKRGRKPKSSDDEQ